jgi:Fe-S-cluster containining protein
MQDLHDAEFKRTDCLKCANCCKTTGPLFTLADIERCRNILSKTAAVYSAIC